RSSSASRSDFFTAEAQSSRGEAESSSSSRSSLRLLDVLCGSAVTSFVMSVVDRKDRRIRVRRGDSDLEPAVDVHAVRAEDDAPGEADRLLRLRVERVAGDRGARRAEREEDVGVREILEDRL